MNEKNNILIISQNDIIIIQYYDNYNHNYHNMKIKDNKCVTDENKYLKSYFNEDKKKRRISK